MRRHVRSWRKPTPHSSRIRWSTDRTLLRAIIAPPLALPEDAAAVAEGGFERSAYRSTCCAGRMLRRRAGRRRRSRRRRGWLERFYPAVQTQSGLLPRRLLAVGGRWTSRVSVQRSGKTTPGHASAPALILAGVWQPISSGIPLVRSAAGERNLINVRFAPKATEVLRCRKASLCAQIQTFEQRISRFGSRLRSSSHFTPVAGSQRD